MILLFALMGACGSAWYWWLRVKELEDILRSTQNALNERGLEIADFDKLIEPL